MKTTKNKIVYEEEPNGVRGKALAVVFPQNDEEIMNLIRLSNSDIIPRGTGINFNLSTLPESSTIVDLSRNNRILSIDLNRKTVQVEVGIIVAELNRELEKYGLEFPILGFFPNLETIGGMIAKNSSGSREIKYNRMINWVESLEIINGLGELKKISKSDIPEIVGMEGTTGIIVRAILRLTTRKERSISILKSYSLNEILKANKRLRLNQEVVSVDLIDRDISELLGLERKYHLIVEYESESGLFKKAAYTKFLKLKEKVYPSIASKGYHLIENSKIFTDSIEDFIIHLERNKIPFFSNLASGVFYTFFKNDDLSRIKQKELNNFVRKLKGKVGYNFGVGILDKEFLEQSEVRILRRIKNRYDPNSKLNRNKLFDFKIDTELLGDSEIKEEKEKIIQTYEPEISKKEEQNPEIITLKREESELSPEEKEKIKKIASGFFGGNR
jgi:FAD/FMN-containing dehydrogenase